MLKKAIFVDRDGTIIREPADEQVDSLEKLEFVPGAISGLRALTGLGYELVLATNQDGLGTDAFPEEDFRPAHEKMLGVLAGEGVVFDDQLIDVTFPEDNAPTRKPGTGMFGKYLSGDYDLAASFVIGDRETDMQLARNLGARGLMVSEVRSTSVSERDIAPENFRPAASIPPTSWAPPSNVSEGGHGFPGANSPSETRHSEERSDVGICQTASKAMTWSQIVEEIRRTERSATVDRKTRETDIHVHVDLDGRGESRIDTGLKFLDHMLDQLVHHGGISLELSCKGDLDVDEHHTMEDVAICLGEALLKALGDKRGIERYGFALPMDESRAVVLLDFGGRAELVWNVTFTREYVGDVPTEMFCHFFKSLCSAMKCNLYIHAEGENNHHIAEAVFKAFARALKQAVRRDVFSAELPSSKGLL